MAERTGLGATDIAPLLGIGQFGSPLSVYCRVLDIGEKPEQNEAMKWGLKLEQAIADEFMALHPDLLAFSPCPKGPDEPMRHRPSDLLPELREPIPILIGTPDRILCRHTADPENWVADLELKTAHYRSARYWGPTGTDEIPEYYVTQVLWQEMLTGLPTAYVAALIGGSDFRQYTIPFDPELGGMMLEAAKRFWQDHIIPRIPPLEVGSADGQALARVFPKHKDEDLAPSTPEIDALAHDLDEATGIIDEAEEVAEDRRNKLKAIIGEHAGIKGEWGKCTWKARKDGEKTDWEALAKALGATKKQIAAHTRTVPGARVFLANFKEEE